MFRRTVQVRLGSGSGVATAQAPALEPAGRVSDWSLPPQSPSPIVPHATPHACPPGPLAIRGEYRPVRPEVVRESRPARPGVLHESRLSLERSCGTQPAGDRPSFAPRAY